MNNDIDIESLCKEHHDIDPVWFDTDQKEDLDQDFILALQLQEQEYGNMYSVPKTRYYGPPNQKVTAVSQSDIYNTKIIDSRMIDNYDCVINNQNQKVGGRLSTVRSQQRAREKKDKRIQKTEIKTPTVEGIDGFSRKILYSLQTNQDVLSKINGCVAQGKEAVIHHAIGGNNEDVHFGEDYAVKIYKTTKVEFRDREKYIEGEWRFRNYEVVKNNPPKMIKIWAEKELRNLKRLQTHGILCPEPILLRKHILVMKFIGHNGYPSPQLEKANLSLEALINMYWKCAGIMRKMYQNAGLVHADLSPYNLLVSGDNLYVIDLAQAVSTDHSHSSEFLRRDCFNITKFFRCRFIPAMMTTRQLFDFITDREVGIDDDSLRDYINTTRSFLQSDSGPMTREELMSEQVWMNINLPQTLKEVPTDSLLEEGVYLSALKDLVTKD